MSDTAVTPAAPTLEPTTPAPTDGFFLDDDAPRLGAAPILAPSPLGLEPAPVTTAAPEPDAPRFAEMAPLVDEADMPTLPTAVEPMPQAIVDDTDEADDEADDGEAAHPMAHLMPQKSKPTEASRRAAEQRAVQKAKAKKIKIGVAIGAIVVSAVAGPPLWSWLSNAVNEAGGTTTEEPTG